MAKQVIVGVLLAALALFVAACEVEEEVERPDATPTSAAYPTAEPTTQLATPDASPSGLAGQGTPVPLGCPSCPVKAGDELDVSAEDVQLGLDDKYYIPDRGDGCAYRETGRAPAQVVGEMRLEGEVMLWAPGCEIGWAYEPTTGRVNPVIP
jgi:hypothetical protein